MEPIYLFDLVSRHTQWTSLRQTTITSNIAQANTPGYKAMDVEPFSAVLSKTHLQVAQTSAGHMDVRDAGTRQLKLDGKETWDVNHSGNSVSIDQEMVKADEVNRAFTLDTSITRAFHRMMLTSVRSQG